MDEWWTYRLSDFLLFSPRTYYRLLARHNESVWPAQIITLGLGAGILALLRRSAPWQGRIISATLAILWAWVAWSFLWQRYAAINWAIKYLVPLFAIQSLLFLWLSLRRAGTSFGWSGDSAKVPGVALFIAALALYPLLAPATGRPWHQAEIFGIAPDPTVIGTLGLLLTIDGTLRSGMLAVPLLWCAITGATLWAMGSPEALVAGLAVLVVVFASRRKPPQ